MRPVDKGNAPKTYTDYKNARHDLAGKIGYYCSYCEMSTLNMIEVEHVHPQANGGNPTSWNNFLLSCKYCNTVKGNDNLNRTGYLWPDIDNTDLAFEYSETDVICPKANLSNNLQILAKSTISLMGLNRIPGGIVEPTEADTRWRSRKEAWDSARKSYTNWATAPILPMAEQIAIASLNGHYSIWMEVFKDEPIVLQEIDTIYRQRGLHKEYDVNTNRKVRTGANI